MTTSSDEIYVGLIEHMGDIVACEPVARYLKSTYPGRKLTWVARPAYAEIVLSNPNVDHFRAVECLTDWIRLTKHVRRDVLVVDLHVNYRACECCRIPLVKAEGRKNVSIHDWYDYGSLLKSFALGAGLPALDDAPVVYISDENVRNVDALHLQESYIVIHRHANDPARNWSDRKWDVLINLLLADGHRVVEVGHRSTVDDSLAARDGYVDIRGLTSILDMAEVMRRAKLYIGIDSGPAHIANAVRTPGVILLGVLGNFKKYMPYTGYYASNSPTVKIIHHPAGPAVDIFVSDVHDAICYVLNEPYSVKKLKSAGLESNEEQPRKKKTEKRQNEKVMVLAFYLPQFYPIPENDAAWEPGFTEWDSVIRSRSWFEGHKQPVEPGELGYYDLRNAEIIEQQAVLAKEHGVDGFCFYYYHFSGKRVLSDPLRNFLGSDVSMPFCLLWANHNWTKKWDAGESEIIIQQDHDDFDDKFFIRSLLDIFRDDRYIMVNDKPVFGVFMPQLFPNIKATTDVWREEAELAGFAGLYLFMIDDWGGVGCNPKEYGFDATYEMPSNSFGKLSDQRKSVNGLINEFVGKIVSYDDLASEYTSRPFPSYKRLKTVMAPWDNSPRYKERAIITRTTGYESYRKWLTSAIVDTYLNHHEEERFVFLHSWNEWAEGTFIEPSRHEGRERLRQTKKAVEAASRVITILTESRRLDCDWSASLKEYFWYLADKIEDDYRSPPADADRALREENDRSRALQEENDRLRTLLALLENSRSMRITKPLRLAKSLFPRKGAV